LEYFANQQGSVVVDAIIRTITENAAYLSDIDGAIGDGDHGINMSKGARTAKERMAGKPVDLTSGLKTLSDVMMDEIGGAMGPLYGTFFRQMFRATRDKEKIDAKIFSDMISRSLEGIKNIGNAQVGDKTLLDTLQPAVDAFDGAMKEGKRFSDALQAMKSAADTGKNSTKDLVAKVGRASRLGERSRGVLDAGATSCCLILSAMADAISSVIE
jgi:phosphoenolpyruvate---glycerone phosphotransferase subunit DhaL